MKLPVHSTDCNLVFFLFELFNSLCLFGCSTSPANQPFCFLIRPIHHGKDESRLGKGWEGGETCTILFEGQNCQTSKLKEENELCLAATKSFLVQIINCKFKNKSNKWKYYFANPLQTDLWEYFLQETFIVVASSSNLQSAVPRVLLFKIQNHSLHSSTTALLLL